MVFRYPTADPTHSERTKINHTLSLQKKLFVTKKNELYNSLIHISRQRQQKIQYKLPKRGTITETVQKEKQKTPSKVGYSLLKEIAE